MQLGIKKESTENSQVKIEDCFITDISCYIIDRRFATNTTTSEPHTDLQQHYLQELQQCCFQLFNLSEYLNSITTTEYGSMAPHYILATQSHHQEEEDSELEPVIIMDNQDSNTEGEAIVPTPSLEPIHKFGSKHLLIILKIIDKHQLLYDEVGSLILSHEKKDLSLAWSIVTHYDSFQVPATGIV